MCIRDSINAEYGDLPGRDMVSLARYARLLFTLAILSSASTDSTASNPPSFTDNALSSADAAPSIGDPHARRTAAISPQVQFQSGQTTVGVASTGGKWQAITDLIGGTSTTTVVTLDRIREVNTKGEAVCAQEQWPHSLSSFEGREFDISEVVDGVDPNVFGAGASSARAKEVSMRTTIEGAELSVTVDLLTDAGHVGDGSGTTWLDPGDIKFSMALNNWKRCECRTSAPTEAPTQDWTEAPTQAPPTKEPTDVPTEAPPTKEPTEAPTEAPTHDPTTAPTEAPTETPTATPTETPTHDPTRAPTEAPTEVPTEAPTEAPTQDPTTAPTEAVSYTHLRAHETVLDLVCRLLLEKKKKHISKIDMS
eukprot:TRINITY_DN8073_c0_g1_i2.p1 TRINITY_DN8073_c0_g1~~TRINITY_DN8073_c0_g1_i2.p1  ORF type:complete len:365 (+),score=58.50 TRINITY_DN8073_c0_g1_i2:126-1220(+)